MPIYWYKSTGNGCEFCQNGFEQMQSMSEKPLVQCPKCGNKVKKVPVPVSGGVPKLSNGRLRDLGFTKFEKRSDGGYEKTP